MKERHDRRPFEQHREDVMKRGRLATRSYGFLAAGAFSALMLAGMPAGVSAQNMADYTNYPIFLSQTVPPNILFLVDMGNATLEAAYSGSNQRYWISYKTGTATASLYASNVTVDSASSDDLVAVDNNGAVINTTVGTSPVASPEIGRASCRERV